MRASLPLLALLGLALLLLCASPPLTSAHSTPHPLSRIALDQLRVQLDGGSISLGSSTLHGMGETVNATFSGISSRYPGSDDWVGVWSPAPTDGNYTRTSPTKYKMVTPDASGAGTVSLWLLNMREDVVVAYMTGGLRAPVMLAVSAVARFDNTDMPMHVHLALTGDVTEMRVDWTSAQSSGLWVRWGLHPTNLTHTLKTVTTTTYTAADMCGAPATTVGFRHPGHLHTAVMAGLTPQTHYFYQVGASTPQSESRVHDFYSTVRPDAEDVQFVIFGDLGQVEPDGSNESGGMMEGSALTTAALTLDVEAGGMVNLSASTAVFHIGDISYARGYVSIWEQFFYQIQAFQPRLPWMTVDGNHERDWAASGSVYTGTDSGGECGVGIASRFHMPTPAYPGGRAVDHTWWSVRFGPVHLTVVSTELPFNRTSEQLRWVEQDWAAVNRTQTPFLLLLGHRPMYIDSTDDEPMGGDQPVSMQLIDAYEPLMQKYQVDLAWWGHHHSMQRTCALHNHTCMDDRTQGTIHIVTGAAGAGFSQNLMKTPPAWIRFVNDSTHGYVNVHVSGRHTLTLDFVRAVDRVVVDSLTIQSHAATAAAAAAGGKKQSVQSD